MRKYYLFLLNDDTLLKYCKDQISLYNTLKKISLSKDILLKYRLSIYNQLCMIIRKDVICNYIEDKYKNRYKKNNNKYLFKNKRTNEICLVEINYSVIIILTSKNYSFIFNILSIYSKNFFVCDFENNDYFLLRGIKNGISIKNISYN